VLLKLLKHHLDITLFRLSKLFILDPFLSNTLIILVLFFQIIWIVEFTRPNPRHKSAFFFSIFCCSYHFKFSFDIHNVPFFITVAILLLYQFPISCRSRKVEGSFTHGVNYHWDLCLSGMLCSIDWKFFTEVLGQPIGPIFKGQVVQKTSESNSLHNVPDEERSHLQCSRSLTSWITVTTLIFQAWNFYSYLKEYRAYLLKEGLILKIAHLLEKLCWNG
jgi:hypothetical protein